jgi:hypothetical protein
MYLLDQHIVNLPQEPFGGVRAGAGLGVRSLILIPDNFLLTTFRGFSEGGGVTVVLRLSARVLEDLALGPIDESMANSALGILAEIGIAGIGESPSKP